MQAATGSAHQWVMVLGAVQSDTVPGSLGGSLAVCVFAKMRLSVGEWVSICVSVCACIHISCMCGVCVCMCGCPFACVGVGVTEN